MYVCVIVSVCVCVTYRLMLHNAQTRDKFPCMILAWTADNEQSYLTCQQPVYSFVDIPAWNAAPEVSLPLFQWKPLNPQS